MNEMDRLPPELRPLSPWTYFGLEILYTLPVIGWIFLICHAVGSANINKRNFARSFFCVYVVVILLAILLGVSGVFSGLTGHGGWA